ncbi:MAG: phosphopantetheine-binding protein [Bradymonadaceae bacterium]
MDKSEIVSLLQEELAEQLDGVEKQDLAPDLSMRDFGANSLDVIEVVTSVMRQLDIKIPRSKLADIETINGLADKFVEHVD